LSTSPSVITDFNEDETWLRFAIVTALSVIDIREENGGTDFVFNDMGFSIVVNRFSIIKFKLFEPINFGMLMHRGATENDCIDGTPISSRAVIMTTRERLTTTIIFFTSVEDK
jgi:hypothetical protein